MPFLWLVWGANPDQGHQITLREKGMKKGMSSLALAGAAVGASGTGAFCGCRLLSREKTSPDGLRR